MHLSFKNETSGSKIAQIYAVIDLFTLSKIDYFKQKNIQNWYKHKI